EEMGIDGTSYTQADNSKVVATDTIFAKTSPHVATPELFALHIASHMVTQYDHVTKAFVDVESLKWSRIPVQGREHEHSFVRDGEEKRVTSVEVDGTLGKDKLVGKVTSGIQDLLVLKSSGSAFENFLKDEYTTLVPVSDRIFSTSVDLQYTFGSLSFGSMDKVGSVDGDAQFNKVAASAKETTLEVFATDESASVQATLYRMASDIIGKNASVESVSYKLPNKHYIRAYHPPYEHVPFLIAMTTAVDLSFFQLANTKPDEAEVFCPVAAPSDLLSRHVNKCHSVDKKPNNNNNNASNAASAATGRRKPRQSSLSQPNATTTTTSVHPPGTSSLTSINPAGNPIRGGYPIHNDPFSSGSLSSSYNRPPMDAPSLSSSSSLASASSASASLDSLPHEPVFHLPHLPHHNVHHYNPHIISQGPTTNADIPGRHGSWGAMSSIAPYGLASMDHANPYSASGSQHSGSNASLPFDPTSNLTFDLYGATSSSSPTKLVHSYNDLPTPLAAPSLPPFRSLAATSDQRPPSSAQEGISLEYGLSSLPHPSDRPPSQQQSHSQNPRLGNGVHHHREFSSAFGLMSLDDPAVLAGISTDGVPFFEQAVNYLPSGGASGPSGLLTNGMGLGIPMTGEFDAQTPNTKEKDIVALREMWAAWLRDPTTGLKPDGTEMGRPEFPSPVITTTEVAKESAPQGLHRRSSSFAGSTKNATNANTTATGGGLAQQIANMRSASASLKSPGPLGKLQGASIGAPLMPLAQPTLHGGRNVVMGLEDQASRLHGYHHPQQYVAVKREDGAEGVPIPPHGSALAPPTPAVAPNPGGAAAPLHVGNPESLKSYEEAVLARKAPVLKLPIKMKTRDGSSSTSPPNQPVSNNAQPTSTGGSGGGSPNNNAILPISQAGRASGIGMSIPANATVNMASIAPLNVNQHLGGGVASLSIQQQQQLPTAAGASSVPPGATPNPAMQMHLESSQAAIANQAAAAAAALAAGMNPGTVGNAGSNAGATTTNVNGVDRPVIAMPKPRSRPGTSSGPNSRPDSVQSRPSSRPGTASSVGAGSDRGGPFAHQPHQGGQGYGSTHSSPPSRPNTGYNMPSHSHSQPNSRPSTSAGPSPSYAFVFAPPEQYQGMSPTGPNYMFQPGSLPKDMLLSTGMGDFSHQLGGGGDTSMTGNGGRPSYKRLASQTLEPASTKRPHLRRGDTNFQPTAEDGSHPNDGMEGMEDSEGMSDAGSERSYGSVSRSRGHKMRSPLLPGGGGGLASAGLTGGRTWSAAMSGDAFAHQGGASARRMSEPAVAATRMMVRMPGGSGRGGAQS
ncbi:14931_t:CDS:2, partial [Acaulospora colombiana]